MGTGEGVVGDGGVGNRDGPLRCARLGKLDDRSVIGQSNLAAVPPALSA